MAQTVNTSNKPTLVIVYHKNLVFTKTNNLSASHYYGISVLYIFFKESK